MKVVVINPDAYFGMQGTKDKLLPAVFLRIYQRKIRLKSSALAVL